MKLSFFFLLIVHLALATKELPGEELPSKESPDDLMHQDGEGSLVKRSISDIAARRRSALDKTFMRFGRSGPPSTTEPRVKLNGNLMRFGRSNSGFMRLGRASNNLMRFGRASNNLMRFGRANNNLMRFGRANNNLMRFGRASNNLMRFGRANNNLMRFGRSGNNLMRFGRGGNNLMRFGRANNLMRFGRSGNLMRFGRSDDEILNGVYDENSSDEDNNDDDRQKRSGNGFLRLGRSIKDQSGLKLNDFDDADFNAMLNRNNEDDESSIDAQDDDLENDKDNLKNIMFYDDKFMKINGDSTGMPADDQQQEDTYELMLPEESRKKRSVLTTPAGYMETSTPKNYDQGSARHSQHTPDCLS